ncbi:MBOAT family O-acyltransferase [Utexia brackfieldae]|uniref:MBOAT family O-acyltransferase n=1 Tax=Utexia brackfieldae TaxID=3074108 RepID=UPI00370DBC0C
MSYLSIEFAVSFIVFFGIYWGLKRHIVLQNSLLLIVSYVIVGLFNIHFALILAGYTIIIYLLSIGIAHSSAPRGWLVLACIVAVVNLAIFKYCDFFRAELQLLLNAVGWHLLLPSAEILLPIGISFYTFHSISYLVSLSKKELKPVSFWDFALYLSFFPSIVAGPINRAKHFLPQIQTTHIRTLLEPYRALTLILLAVIKVYWLSSALADYYVNPIFDSPQEYQSFDLILGLYAYAIEIYLNFSGYTDLVTAIALLLGFRLPINFNLPYLAINLRDFWQRWHISLSTWIRDYIYIPLGGSRINVTRTQINVLIAMLLSGLWHGAGMNFLLWGAIHGIGLVMLNVADRLLGVNVIARRSALIAKLFTLHYVCFAWLFFRSASLSDALDYLQAIAHNMTDVAMKYNSLLTIIILLIAYCFYPKWSTIPTYFSRFLAKMPWFILPVIFICILWLVIYLAPSGIPQFIYAGF